MKVTSNYMMVQWFKKNPRFKGEDGTFIFDLVLTRCVDLKKKKKSISSIRPFAKGHHVLMKMEVVGNTGGNKREKTGKLEGIMKDHIMVTWTK